MNILKINYFKGTLALPYSEQYSVRNLEVAREVLRGHAFTERSEGELNDNWIVF